MSKLPSWLIKKTPKQINIRKIRELLNDENIHTVCESARCPNIGECYSQNSLTFMILGNSCTRNCSFCAVDHSNPSPPDPQEPKNIAQAVKKLNLNYIVITSVTRDDLEDGGAEQFKKCILEINKVMPQTKIEILIPDFQGNPRALEKVINAKPYVLNHNIETVPRLYSSIRPQANYKQSIKVLETAKQQENALYTKSGFMVGLGEIEEEIVVVLEDLRKAQVDIVTIGQYISPSKNHAEVKEYINPNIFEKYRQIAITLGFKQVFSGPFVRSSYHAKDIIENIK